MIVRILTSVSLLAAIAGCAGGGEGSSGPEHPWVTEAKIEFPTALDLHTKVIARSCGPSTGVCHNTKEFPDLHTAGNFVTAVSRPCNVDLSDSAETFDGCEPPADELVVDEAHFRSRIGFLGNDEYDPETGMSYRRLVLAEPAPASATYAVGRILRNGSTLLTLQEAYYGDQPPTPSDPAFGGGGSPPGYGEGVIELYEDSKEARLVNTYMLDYATYLALETVQSGDPNGNGVYGAESAWKEIVPGHPEKSYLIGRITGTVPGSRMPLANQALTDPEYVAVFCWIESIGAHPRAEDRIDYDGCKFAQAPIAYAIP